MTLFNARLAAVAAACLAVPASAQDLVQFRAGFDEMPQAGISVLSVDPVSVGETVTNAPYSAEAVTEVNQVLADGNRIERRTVAAIARAGDGRIRREQQAFALGGFVGESPQPLVTITDPKNGVHLTLNYDLKVAYRMKPGFVTSRVEGGAVTWSVGPLGPRGGAAPPPGRRLGGAMAPPPPPPDTFETPVVATAPMAVAQPLPWSGETKTESLEPRTIEGLHAEGTRTTVTIAAGAVGNSLPIEVISERWFSPELQVLLMTRRYDPRFGETVYRLTNIVRAEPAPDLFTVPAGFRVENVRP